MASVASTDDPWLIEGFDPGRPVPVAGTVGASVVDLAVAREAAEIELIGVLRGFEANDLHADDGYRSVYSWIRDHTDLSRGDAARLLDTARFLDRHDHADASVTSGKLVAAKASALARVDTAARRDLMIRDLAALISAVAPLDVDAAARVIAQWARLADNEVGLEPDDAKARQRLHASRTLNGMVRLDGLLDAETGSIVLAALEALDHPDPIIDGVPVRTRSQRNAENLGEMARRSLASDGHLDPDRTVNVVVDADLIPHDTHDDSGCDHGAAPTANDTFDFDSEPHTADHPGDEDDLIDVRDGDDDRRDGDAEPSELIRTLTGRCEIVGHGPANPHTVARLMCDNWISRVVLSPTGVLLDLGRRQRLFNASQRRAIAIRDGHCVFGNCDAPPERCDTHHLDPWEHGGHTNLENGCLLCRRHHHLVHEGGWQITINPDRSLTWS
jgi:hypothetical protein